MSVFGKFRAHFKQASGQDSPYKEVDGYRLLGFEIGVGETGALKALARIETPEGEGSRTDAYDADALKALIEKPIYLNARNYLRDIQSSLGHRQILLTVVQAFFMAPLSSEQPNLMHVVQTAESWMETHLAIKGASERRKVLELALQTVESGLSRQP